MAMKKCKECGEEISSSAKKCPKCGKDQRNFFMKHPIIYTILILIVIGAVVGSGGNDNTTQTSSGTSGKTNIAPETIEYTTIDVDTLDEALKNNAAAAKDTYNNKYLEIKGRLGTIDSDLKYISLLSATDEWDMIGIHCSIKNDEQKEIIKTLKTDDIIVVKGQITNVGEVMGYYLDIIEIVK